MADGTTSNVQKEWVRAAFGDRFKSYTVFNIKTNWKTPHADLSHFVLSKKNKKKKDRDHHFVSKRYVLAPGEYPAEFRERHHPDLLYMQELRNLHLIRKHVGGEFSRPIMGSMLAEVQGSAREHNLIIMNYLRGDHTKNKLLKAWKKVGPSPSPESRREFDDIFLKGIIGVARFVGACNAVADKLRSAHDYESDRDLFERMEQVQYKEGIARLTYHSNEECREKVQLYNTLRGLDPDQFSLASVIKYIQLDKGINLDDRLSEIRDRRKVLDLERKFAHGDSNGTNQIGQRVLDLEDFGTHRPTFDLASFSTILGLVGHQVVNSTQFPYFIQAFLAVEHAYEKDPKNREQQLTLENAKNGTFRDYVGKNIAEDYYSRFLLGTFDQMIEREVFFGGAYHRHPDPTRIFGSHPPNTKEVVEELYTVVAQLSSDFDVCSDDQKTVRGLFYAVGNLLNDLGITNIPSSTLNTVNADSTGERLARARPNFEY